MKYKIKKLKCNFKCYFNKITIIQVLLHLQYLMDLYIDVHYILTQLKELHTQS